MNNAMKVVLLTLAVVLLIICLPVVIGVLAVAWQVLLPIAGIIAIPVLIGIVIGTKAKGS